MKILIDGDSCCVLRTTEQIAKQYNIPCHIYCDSSRILQSDYSEIKIVEKGRNSADFAIVNHCCDNDIVITNDSGLAAMVLAKRGKAIKSNGIEFTQSNISEFLNKRYVNSFARRKNNKLQVKGRLYNDKSSVKTNYRYTLTEMIKRQTLMGVTV